MTRISLEPMDDLARAHHLADFLRTLNWDGLDHFAIIAAINQLYGPVLTEAGFGWLIRYAGQHGPIMETPAAATTAWCDLVATQPRGSWIHAGLKS